MAELHSEPNSGESKEPKKIKTSKTPMLDSFGRDLTKAAEEGKLDPVIGRDIEIQRISQILSRRKKNNPILIGESGSGKTALAEGLAQKIIQRKVSRTLFNKRIISLDISSIVAGTKYRGQFEERMKAIIDELENNKDVILFMDEIHTIVGAGSSSGSLDAANIFKPALSRGGIQCIGATTIDEYKKSIEKDGALERRFQKVVVNPTSIEDTILILNQLKSKYEEHHHVKFTDAAIEACVNLSERYINDRHLPDKAIDIMDEAGSRVYINNIDVPKEITEIEEKLSKLKDDKNVAVKTQKFETAAELRDIEKRLIEELDEHKLKWENDIKSVQYTVDEELISDVVSMITGIPVNKINNSDSERLKNLEANFNKLVIGQEEAIKRIARAVKRSRTGMKDPNKPISFIFSGSTGVGKSYLAKTLANLMYGGEDSMIRVDMSEYGEKIAVSRLIGAAPGYVGYEEGGQLTEKVRRKPYSVILFDEIEKAHPDVFNLLLQILDDGRLTDSFGRTANFSNCIIILTTNAGATQFKEFGSGIGLGMKKDKESQYDNMKGIMETALKKQFKPEFLNRIDDIVVFKQLQKEDVRSIVDLNIGKLITRLNKTGGHVIEVSERLKEHICSIGFDKEYGARPLNRAIQKCIEDNISDYMIDNYKMESLNILVDIENDEIKIVEKV